MYFTKSFFEFFNSLELFKKVILFSCTSELTCKFYIEKKLKLFCKIDRLYISEFNWIAFEVILSKSDFMLVFETKNTTRYC